MSATARDPRARMDAIYRHQRHVYDATRRFALAGRDRLVERLAVPVGARVLEIGCGTGRNLVRVARRFPEAHLYGLDVSPLMLETARRAVARSGLAGRVMLAEADAASADPRAVLGVPEGFDRVVISYALSMIPDWRSALAHAMDAVAPGGELWIVDFGGQSGWPRAWRRVLAWWLARFSVTPREELAATLEALAAAAGGRVEIERLRRDYALLAVVRRPA